MPTASLVAKEEIVECKEEAEGHDGGDDHLIPRFTPLHGTDDLIDLRKVLPHGFELGGDTREYGSLTKDALSRSDGCVKDIICLLRGFLDSRSLAEEKLLIAT